VIVTAVGSGTCLKTGKQAKAMNWTEFFHMGGYAFYVWTSYTIALVLLVANMVLPVVQRKKIIARIRRSIRREQLELEQKAHNATK
jgi:heme exporter protein D